MSLLWHQHAIALALAATDVIVRGFRMRQLVPLSLGQAVRVNAYGDAAAMLTPARLGGEPARYAGLRRDGADPATIVAALGVELIADWCLVLAVGGALAAAFARHSVGFLPRLRSTVMSAEARWLMVIAVVLSVIGAVVLVRGWGWKRLPVAARGSLAESFRRVRTLPARTGVIVAVLTVVSIAARICILPVLVSQLALVSLGGSLLGSYVLTFGQHVFPSPAGVGGVELMFLAGFAGTASPADVAGLLLVWRWYAFLLGAGLGGLFLVAQASRTRIGTPSTR